MYCLTRGQQLPAAVGEAAEGGQVQGEHAVDASSARQTQPNKNQSIGETQRMIVELSP